MRDTRKPRVLMVVRLFHPWVGGMERQALALAVALSRLGINVRIVTGRWFRGTSRRETIDGIGVIRHNTLWEGFGIRGLRRVGGVVYMLSLASYLFFHRRDYDIIHVHGLSYHAFVASVLGRRLGKPVIVKLANSGAASDIDKMKAGQHLPLTRLMLPAALSCDRLVVLNELIATELKQEGVDADRLERIPNGVVVPAAIQPPAQDERFQILFLGRLHPQKGLDVLLEALRRAMSLRGVGFRLVLAGDGPERARLEKLAADLGLGAAVEFLGMVDDPRRYLAVADLVVLPSYAEGLSNVLLEAMAEGLAVVASDIEANRSLIDDGVNGRLFNSGDAADLARVLIELADDPDTRSALGRRARSTVENHYAMEEVATRYERLYAELMAEAHR